MPSVLCAAADRRRVEHGPVGVGEPELRKAPVAPDAREPVVGRGVGAIESQRRGEVIEGLIGDAGVQIGGRHGAMGAPASAASVSCSSAACKTGSVDSTDGSV